MNQLLSILAGKLVLRDDIEFLMHTCSLLPLSIEDWHTLSNLSQTPYYRHMDESNRLIDVRVIDPGDESSLCFLDKMFLDDPDILHMLYVFVVSWVNSHMLCPNSESLLVFLFILNTDYERYAGGILLHHIHHKPDREMDPFHNQGLILGLIVINDFLKFCEN